jgi:hypothetical protein
LVHALRTHDAQLATTIAREHVLSVHNLLMKRRASG